MSLDFENMPERIDSEFRFILVAAERAEQLMRGAPPKIAPAAAKPTLVAMEEVLDDVVDWDYGPAPVVEVALEAEEAAPEDEPQ